MNEQELRHYILGRFEIDIQNESIELEDLRIYYNHEGKMINKFLVAKWTLEDFEKYPEKWMKIEKAHDSTFGNCTLACLKWAPAMYAIALFELAHYMSRDMQIEVLRQLIKVRALRPEALGMLEDMHTTFGHNWLWKLEHENRIEN